VFICGQILLSAGLKHQNLSWPPMNQSWPAVL
jgi:hypothetical protein